jgi:hypothetical protein
MENPTHYPLLVFVAALVSLWFASAAGSWLRRRFPTTGDERNEDLGVILAATLTLLALIIGFSFSMATNRSKWMYVSDSLRFEQREFRLIQGQVAQKTVRSGCG